MTRTTRKKKQPVLKGERWRKRRLSPRIAREWGKEAFRRKADSPPRRTRSPSPRPTL